MSYIDVIQHCRSVTDFVRYRQIHRLTPGCRLLAHRRLSQHVHPTTSIFNVQPPDHSLIVPRRFTPDGKLLIGSGRHLQKILIFTFNGAMAGSSRLPDINSRMPGDIFSAYFTLRWEIALGCPAPLQVHTSLVTPDSRFLLAVVRRPCAGHAAQPPYHKLNEHVAVDGISGGGYQDWSVLAISLDTGTVTSRLHLPMDALCSPQPENHLTCYLHNYTMVVLSVAHQTIEFYHLTFDGVLAKGLVIGRFCRPDDEAVFSRGFLAPIDHPWHQSFSNEDDVPPHFESAFVGLKQKLMDYVFRDYLAGNEPHMFFKSFSFLRDMRIARLQVLSEEKLFLRYEPCQQIWRHWAAECAAVLGVYNVRRAVFERVFISSSPEAVMMLQECPDGLDGHGGPIRSPSVELLQSEVREMLRKKSITEVGEHFKNALPIRNQISSYSPYADPSLFTARPHFGKPFRKAPGDIDGAWENQRSSRMDFVSTSTGQICFSMRAVPSDEYVQRLLILHPCEPMALSVALLRFSEYPVIAMHLRQMHNPHGDCRNEDELKGRT